MRVALFSRFPANPDAPRGGVETVTLGLTRALSERPGLQVDVVALERGRRELRVENFGKATIHRLPGSRIPQMLDILYGPGRSRIRRYLMELRPDVVHFHETYGYFIRPLPMPMVFTIHGFDHANIPAEGRAAAWLRVPLWRAIENAGLRRQRDIISITPYVREHINGRTPARIHEIENPLQPAFFEIPRATVAGRIFFAGWITPRKNPLTLVRAFARLHGSVADATLHLAGELKDPPYAEQVKAEIARHKLEDRVKLLGRISPADIRRELGEAAVSVLPSLQENAPMAISEALAAGVPVIAADRCGMPYMVAEGRTGFLVEPMDDAQIADRLQRVLTDATLQARMSEAARIDARARYHPDSVADKTIAVYRSLLADHQNGTR